MSRTSVFARMAMGPTEACAQSVGPIAIAPNTLAELATATLASLGVMPIAWIRVAYADILKGKRAPMTESVSRKMIF